MIIQRYVSKISGPLRDRIDIHIDVPSVNYRELRGGAAPENSAAIRSRVIRAREIQLESLWRCWRADIRQRPDGLTRDPQIL